MFMGINTRSVFPAVETGGERKIKLKENQIAPPPKKTTTKNKYTQSVVCVVFRKKN